MSPQKPEVGKHYYLARCKFDALNPLVEDGRSNAILGACTALNSQSRPPAKIEAPRAPQARK